MLDYHTIEIINMALDNQISGLRALSKMHVNDAAAMLSFANNPQSAIENMDQQEFRNILFMQIDDMKKAKEAFREATGL